MGDVQRPNYCYGYQQLACRYDGDREMCEDRSIGNRINGGPMVLKLSLKYRNRVCSNKFCLVLKSRGL